VAGTPFIILPKSCFTVVNSTGLYAKQTVPANKKTAKSNCFIVEKFCCKNNGFGKAKIVINKDVIY
jgi:hypothetical protein